MTFPSVETLAVRVFQYSLASGDMYYAELEQRDVLLGKDDAGNARIWGQSTGKGASSRIGLCRVFLEYGMYCASWCRPGEAQYHMENFGERLGYHLAMYLRDDPASVTPGDPTVHALEQIFEAIGADFTEDHLEAGVRFLISHCPIEDAAKRSGLPYAELARHGMNAMCRRLIREMDPSLLVVTSPDNQPELMFMLTPAAIA